MYGQVQVCHTILIDQQEKRLYVGVHCPVLVVRSAGM